MEVDFFDSVDFNAEAAEEAAFCTQVRLALGSSAMDIPARKRVKTKIDQAFLILCSVRPTAKLSVAPAGRDG